MRRYNIFDVSKIILITFFTFNIFSFFGIDEIIAWSWLIVMHAFFIVEILYKYNFEKAFSCFFYVFLSIPASIGIAYIFTYNEKYLPMSFVLAFVILSSFYFKLFDVSLKNEND